MQRSRSRNSIYIAALASLIILALVSVVWMRRTKETEHYAACPPGPQYAVTNLYDVPPFMPYQQRAMRHALIERDREILEEQAVSGSNIMFTSVPEQEDEFDRLRRGYMPLGVYNNTPCYKLFTESNAMRSASLNPTDPRGCYSYIQHDPSRNIFGMEGSNCYVTSADSFESAIKEINNSNVVGGGADSQRACSVYAKSTFDYNIIRS
jgi:hypothetical protein